MERKDIPGQEELLDVFVRMIDTNKLPHGMLIHGVEGGLGLPLALFITQYLFCDNPTNGDTCGACPNCTKLESAIHPDVHYAVPVTGNKSLKTEHACTDKFIEQWRDALIENPYLSLKDWYPMIGVEKGQGFLGDAEAKYIRSKLVLRAYEGKHKVFIIWHADKMNDAFANKMLKSLEEPNERTLLILVSNHPSQLLPTVLSRVQRFQELPISDERVAKFLVENHDISEEEALNIAFRTEGNLSDAIAIAREVAVEWWEHFRSWMRHSYNRDLIALYKWSEEMAKNNRDMQRQFIESALFLLDRCFRMGWINLNAPTEGEEAKFYRDFSPFINSSNIHGFVDLLEETSFHIERNLNERVVWYDTSIKAIRLVHEGKKAKAAS